VNRASAGFKKKTLVFRKIALESKLPPHNDGAGHRVLERTESCTQSQSGSLWADLLACPSRVRDESGPRGTSGQSNTHSTESREIHYLWHPWCGRSVWIHGKVVKGGRAVYRCSLEQNHEARLFEVPQWMFESGACGQVRSAEKPAVNCAALLDLKLLLHHARSTARNLVLQAQHSSSPGGGADAKIGKATEGYPTGIVSPTTSDSKLAKVTARNQTEDSGTTGATAARTSQENPGLPARKGERR